MKLTKERMLSAFPKDSALFDKAVDEALRRVHQQAVKEKARPMAARRAMSWVLAGALLLVSALGVAEGIRRGVFDILIGREDVLPQATELVQQELAERTIGRTTLGVTEAVYDGSKVRLVLSVRNETIDRPITANEANGDGEFAKALEADGVTALHSFDRFTVDGVEYGMTGGSGGVTVPGDNNGEALVYFELLLSESVGEQIDAPARDFTLGLPVCSAAEPKDRQLLIPIKYVAANLLRNLTPAAPVTFGAGETAYTVTVTEATLSPVKNTVELRVDVPDTVNEEAAWDCISPWYDIGLVDEKGAELGSGAMVYNGMPADETDDARHFMIRVEYPPMATYPDKLFAAPMTYDANGDWEADMSRAIELNGEEK